ncbi:MAG: hypothetical protein EBT12_13160 [Marivivens sp.]|nr:hypothetical protein [Marivivens sp.]
MLRVLDTALTRAERESFKKDISKWRTFIKALDGLSDDLSEEQMEDIGPWMLAIIQHAEFDIEVKNEMLTEDEDKASRLRGSGIKVYH